MNRKIWKILINNSKEESNDVLFNQWQCFNQ